MDYEAISCKVIAACHGTLAYVERVITILREAEIQAWKCTRCGAQYTERDKPSFLPDPMPAKDAMKLAQEALNIFLSASGGQWKTSLERLVALIQSSFEAWQKAHELWCPTCGKPSIDGKDCATCAVYWSKAHPEGKDKQG